MHILVLFVVCDVTLELYFKVHNVYSLITVAARSKA
jgi:hypothetical protein